MSQSLVMRIRDFFTEPRLIGKNPNSDEFLNLHKKIIEEKPMLRGVFEEFYETCNLLDEKHLSSPGVRVEIGAGVSFIKKIFPKIISTDIKNAPHLDMVLDAQAMIFENTSVRSIYGINCFHHFPRPEAFFKELERVLFSGGGCILIEPYYGLFARYFYKKVFKEEHFNMFQGSWDENAKSMGVMVGANQALSYIVFKRDLKKFSELFPSLVVVETKPFSNYARYLLSGGLNFNSLVPSSWTGAIRCLEWVLKPFSKIFALHHVIVIRKK